MDGMANDIDQQLRDYQREYLDFIDDDVSIRVKPRITTRARPSLGQVLSIG